MTDSRGHWCYFCQLHHSSMTCFHPGRRYKEQEVQRLEIKLDKVKQVYWKVQGDTVLEGPAADRQGYILNLLAEALKDE